MEKENERSKCSEAKCCEAKCFIDYCGTSYCESCVSKDIDSTRPMKMKIGNVLGTKGAVKIQIIPIINSGKILDSEMDIPMFTYNLNRVSDFYQRNSGMNMELDLSEIGYTPYFTEFPNCDNGQCGNSDDIITDSKSFIRSSYSIGETFVYKNYKIWISAITSDGVLVKVIMS